MQRARRAEQQPRHHDGRSHHLNQQSHDHRIRLQD
jgi:hypothetical protein